MDSDRLKVLLDLYLDEGLDVDTKLELEQMLLEHPFAREMFWETSNFNSMLRQLGQESWGHETLPADTQPDAALPADTLPADTQPADTQPAATPAPINDIQHAPVPFFSWNMPSIVGLVLAVTLVAWMFSSVWLLKRDNLSTQVTPSNAEVVKVSQSDRPVWVAILREAINVQWIDEANAPSLGEAMTARRIQFESGIVEIQTDRGAVVTLAGPADLDVISGMEVNCRSGQISVNVPPPAHGFLVHTPSINVVDRGTSFSMNVRDQESTAIHVTEGMVELVSKQPSVAMRQLHEGQSVDVIDGVYREISSDDLISTAVSLLSQRKTTTNYLAEAWDRRRRAIANDEHCFLYFDFEDSEVSAQDDIVLVNRALDARPATNGTIVGCNWTEGRWPGKRALEFKNLFDRLLVNVPGEHPTLTCFASVRLDAMDSWSSSLLTNLDTANGGYRWHVSPNRNDPSRGHLGLRTHSHTNGDAVDEYLSDGILRPEQFGTWMQVALVWDSQHRECRHYVDGKLVSQASIRLIDGRMPALAKTSQLEIGNGTLGEHDGDFPVRSFSGRIDEFAMFDRALSSQEIHSLHELSRTTWKGSDGDAAWDNEGNWVLGLTPAHGDMVYLDRQGQGHARYQAGQSDHLQALRVGTGPDSDGELEVTGGQLIASSNSSTASRIGVAGGNGSSVQSGGRVVLNSLQIGLDPDSIGTYHLSGGNLIIQRGVSHFIGSIDVGIMQGVGRFEISGGALATRTGVTLGRDDGLGTWCVRGSRTEKIDIGLIGNKDGFWVQNTKSSLVALVDQNGLTTIRIRRGSKGGEDPFYNQRHGDVIFRNGAILDLDFIGTPRSGSWDVMQWDGKLFDEGLGLANHVDKNIWKFEFVDTDQSGTVDTLRATANLE